MQPILYAFSDEADQTLSGQIAALRRNNLSGMEIRGVDGQNVSQLPLERARDIRGALADAGLKVWSVGSPIGKINIETDDFEKHLEVFRHTLDVARALACRKMRVFSFYIPHGAAASDYKGEVIDRLGRMLEIARGWDVALCHENEKGIYGDNAARCKELLDALPSLLGVFDPANFIQCGQETLAAWELLKRRTAYLHIKDCLPSGAVVPAGRGVGHVGDIVRDYLAAGGREMTIEPHLITFAGLEALEKAGKASVIGREYAYETPGAAFDAACRALKEVLEA